MHSFEVHSNESACTESGRLGLKQVQCVCPVLLMCFFLSVNGPVCRCALMLIDYNIDIDSWDCWDFVLSVFGTSAMC